MENKNSIIPTILHALGLTLLLVVGFVGCIYLFKESIILGVVVMALAIIILVLLVAALVVQKQKEVNKGFTVFEGILLAIYLGAAVGSYFVISHTINLELNHKSDVVNTATDILNDSKSMLSNYEKKVGNTKSMIETRVKKQINSYENKETSKSAFNDLQQNLTGYGIEVAYEKDKNRNVERANLKLENGLEASEGVALEKLDSVETTTFEEISQQVSNIDDWNRFKLHSSFQRLSELQPKMLDQLKAGFQQAQFRDPNEEFSFDYPLTLDYADIISSPATLRERYSSNPLPAILLTLLIYTLILTPYFRGRYGIRRVYSREDLQGGIELRRRA